MWPGSNENEVSPSTSEIIQNNNQREIVGPIYQRSTHFQREAQESPVSDRSSWRRREPYHVSSHYRRGQQAASDSSMEQSGNISLSPYFSRSFELPNVGIQWRPHVDWPPLPAADSQDSNTARKSKSDEEKEPHLPPARVLLRGLRAKRRIKFSPTVWRMALKLIKQARENKILDVRKVLCRTCENLPVRPVTGTCGHTRCTKCIEQSGSCPCGGRAPRELFVDVLSRQLIEKMLQDGEDSDINFTRARGQNVLEAAGTSATLGASTTLLDAETALSVQICEVSSRESVSEESPRVPMTPLVRLGYARALISAGHAKEAVAQLARVATYEDPIAPCARTLLLQILDSLTKQENHRVLTVQVKRLIQNHATTSWLSASDLECPLCLQTFNHPVTTPCGHTFCRYCIERLIDYRKPCALCQRPLNESYLSLTEETFLVKAALESINAVKPRKMLDRNVIYVIACTVAFPKVPCPLFIFDPRYWFVIRRVLESGTRMFGMVAPHIDGNCRYGTVLEVRDCVLLENGSFILSTVGVSRFQALETSVWDGCEVARIKRIVDVFPTDHLSAYELQNISSITHLSAVYWLSSINPVLRDSIEATFGALPDYFDNSERFWETPDGPDWLWWFIAILPLKTDIKILILSTNCIFKRFMAVIRTLEAMRHIPDTRSNLACELYNTIGCED